MSSYMNPKYAALEAYTPGEQPRDQQYIKLNTNESPFPPAPEVVNMISHQSVENLRLYSDPTAKVLRQKLAELYGVQPEQVFVSNGSDDILNFAFMAFGGDGVVFPDITYGFYPVFAQLHGLESREIPLKPDFSLDHRDYCGVGKMVVFANPNAPTGRTISLGQIEGMLKTNPGHVVLVDEAYVDFGGESALALLPRYPNLLVVRTFSKSRCLAGGRLGYAFGSAELIADLQKLQYSTNPYAINRLTMALGEATVDNEAYYQEKCQEIIRVRGITTEKLEAMGFEVLPSSANFIFAKHPTVDGEALYLELKRRGILVRHFSKPAIRDFNRITIGTEAQMLRLCQVISDIVGGTP